MPSEWSDQIPVPVLFCPKCHHDFRPQPGSGDTEKMGGKTMFKCFYQCANEDCKHSVWMKFHIQVRFHPLTWPGPSPIMQFRMMDDINPIDNELGGKLRLPGEDYFEECDDEDGPIILRS